MKPIEGDPQPAKKGSYGPYSKSSGEKSQMEVGQPGLFGGWVEDTPDQHRGGPHFGMGMTEGR